MSPSAADTWRSRASFVRRPREGGRLERYLSDMDRGEVHFSEERNPRISDPEV